MVESTRAALLEALMDSDEELWNDGDPPSIERRNNAARAALAGGWTADELASALNVLPDDVRSWVNSR